jgi:hypothetical protein
MSAQRKIIVGLVDEAFLFQSIPEKFVKRKYSNHLLLEVPSYGSDL